MSDLSEKWPDAVHESGHAAAACYLGWPVLEVSVQATKAGAASRVGVCRLAVEPLPDLSHEDVLRSIIYLAGGNTAEYLMGLEFDPAAAAPDNAQIEQFAAHAFPDNRAAQTAIVKRGEEAAMEVVRRYRAGIETLAAALVRLGRVEGTTAERFIKTARRPARV